MLTAQYRSYLKLVVYVIRWLVAKCGQCTSQFVTLRHHCIVWCSHFTRLR